MIELIRRYHIMLPARIAMLLKALITLEGTARLVSPKFSLIEMMQPYRQEDALAAAFAAAAAAQDAAGSTPNWSTWSTSCPQGIVDILEQVQSGRFDVHLDHRGLEPSVNRLVLGMLASALFVGLVAAAEPQRAAADRSAAAMLPDVSAPGSPAVVSIALGLRLWRAINKSGHLDRKKRD